MKNMKKRLLSTLLALCIALALLPGTAWADGEGILWYPVTGGNIGLVRSTGIITSCNPSVTEAIIPSTIEDFAVTAIGESSFSGRRSLVSVTIPDSVTTIGKNAFWNCESLTSVAIPDSVTTIGRTAFSGCSSLTNIAIPNSVTAIEGWTFYDCYSLTSIIIPDSVTTIGEYAFSNCTSLTNITIPSGITTIEYCAFSGSGLTSVTIPDGVTAIGQRAFQKCSSLSSMTIPASVTTIEADAFGNCENLTDVYYGGSEEQWNQIVGNLVGYDSSYIFYVYGITMHYNSTGPDSAPGTPTPNASEYIYNTADPGASVTLDSERLNSVTDSISAASAVQAQTQSMTTEQKTSATGADLATLYAETAVSKAASKTVSGANILINKAAVTELEPIAKQTSAAVEGALVSGGISTARYIGNVVTLTTEETGEISIRIDPDILTTEVDKVVVEAPTYAITLKVADFAEDLTQILTITAQDVGSGFAPGSSNAKATVKVNLPNGKTSNSVTLSLPKASGDTTYQTVVNTSGTATSSKYNPATTAIDGKVNTSGSYTVQTNQADFTDISNKSAEMQTAIRYLAARGIIGGTGGTNYSPDDSITRAQIAALIIRALGKVDEGAKPTFKDVTTKNWYYSTAAVSQKAGIINGYEDNTYRGDNQILKEQIVAIAARVLKSEMGYKEPSNASSYLSKYSDSVAEWAQPEVALATRENIVVYRTDGTFSGAKGMTRGDAAIIIYRLFQRIW